ncbi:MAG: gliding motility-associated C-terminal domain-containing protein [Bacteroidetes bacterium]|nr:gliding motility-associated C-terminal domain-containing protein [Bacteroidota bacterium]
MNVKKQIIAFVFFLSLFCLQLKAQVSIASGVGMTPLQLVQNFLVGNGVIVSNVKFNDSPNVIATSNQIGSFTTGTPTNLGFGTGLTIATGGVQIATMTGTLTLNITGTQITSDPQLQALKPGKSLHDIARLEFDFIPSSDTVKFRYVFASNEYLTAVCTNYDDVFGFFISGANPAGGNYVNQNIALVPGTNLPVSINTINGGVSMGNITPCYLTYTQYYHTLSQNLTYLGATVPLTAWAKVKPCTSYHIKMAICDISNAIYDSGVFLEANSFTSPQLIVTHKFTNPAVSDTAMVRGCNNAVIKLKLPQHFNYNYPVQIIKQGTAINGFDYPSIPDTVFIPANTDSVLFTITPYNNAGFITPKLIQLVIKTSVCSYDTLKINIFPNLPLIVNAIGDTSICSLSNIHISVSGSGGIQPYIFTWNNGDTNTQRIVNPSNTTLYQVVLKDKCNQIAKDSVLITVFPDFVLNATANPNPICKGEFVQLNVSGAIKYFWTTNIPDPSLVNKDTLHNPIVKPSKTTIYHVTGYDTHGCKATDSVQVILHPLLNAAIIANPNPVSVFDPTVHFIDASSGSISWSWNTDDGFTANVRDFIHAFSSSISKNYHVTLMVSNASGCVDSAAIDIFIYPELKIFIPNAFTPDIPGLNNVFKAYGEGMVKFEMYIYNRWGQLIFSTKDINSGWDGKFANENVAAGVYVYSAYYKDFLGKEFNKNGSVTLIR